MSLRRGTRHALCGLVLAASIGPSVPTAAQTSAPPGSAAVTRPVEQTSDFWRELRQPGHRRVAVLMRHGRVLVARALQERNNRRPHLYAAWLEGAIERFRRAHALVPEDPEPLIELAVRTAMYERPRPGEAPERRVAEAIALYHQVRALDPAYLPEVVAFELALLHSREGETAVAIVEYKRALEHAATMSAQSASTTSSNLAETLMMDGQLTDAVSYYELAIDYAEEATDERSLFLAHFGLAVALDRLGEHHSALDHAARARSVFGGGMEGLTDDPNVFFEPESEVHYYVALGHMAYAEAAPREDARPHWQQALRAWTDYLALSEDGDPWRALAERHRREVEERLAR